jgi:hypothetical protein
LAFVKILCFGNKEHFHCICYISMVTSWPFCIVQCLFAYVTSSNVILFQYFQALLQIRHKISQHVITKYSRTSIIQANNRLSLAG